MVWNLRLMTILFNVIFFIFFIQQDFPQNYEVNFCFRVGAVSEVRRQTIWYDMRANSNLRSGENFVRGDEGTSADTSHQLSLFPLCPTYEGLPGELTRPEWGQVGVGRHQDYHLASTPSMILIKVWGKDFSYWGHSPLSTVKTFWQSVRHFVQLLGVEPSLSRMASDMRRTKGTLAIVLVTSDTSSKSWNVRLPIEN